MAAWLAHRLPIPALARPLAATVGIVGPLIPGTVVVAVAPGLDRWPPPATDLVLTTSRRGEGSRVVRLPVGPEGRPILVEKLSNRPRYEEDSSGEQSALAYVAERLPPTVEGTFPRPLGQDRVAGALRVRESYCDGPTVAQNLSRWTPRRRAEVVLDAAVDWLLEIQRATAVPGTWQESESDEFLRRPLEELRRLSGKPLNDLGRLVELVADQALGAPMARSLRHYDVGPWNLVLSPAVKVVDWELRPPRNRDRMGLAGADLHYLVTYWRHLVVGSTSSDQEDRVSGLVPPESRRDRWAVEVGRMRLKRSFTSTGLGLDCVAGAWVHNWLEQAVYRHHRYPDGTDGRAFDYLRLAAANPERLLRL